LKIKIKEASGKAAYSTNDTAGEESVRLELRNQKVYFNVLKHDKLFSRSPCFVNFSLNEKRSFYNKGQKTTLNLKQSPKGVTEDGDSCWPGLDINVPLTMNTNRVGEARDENYLYNMAKIENLFDPKMF